MLLYKFLSPERIDVLQNGMIRFTQPAALNDPFECRPRNYGLQMLPTQELSGDPQCAGAYVDGVQNTLTLEERKAVGILCLVEDATNIAMWAHYAAEHKGFVLGFDGDHSFFEKRSDGTGLWKVRYSDARPLRPLAPTLEHLSQQPGPHSLGLLDVSFPTAPRFNPDTYPEDYRFVKGTCWQYEKEWRLLRTLEHPDRTIDQKNRLPIHLFHFPPDCLKCVIVGCRGLRTLYGPIREILDSNSAYSHVTTYVTEPDNNTFSLEIRPFQPPKELGPTELNQLPLPEQVDFMLAKGILVSLDEVGDRVDPDGE